MFRLLRIALVLCGKCEHLQVELFVHPILILVGRQVEAHGAIEGEEQYKMLGAVQGGVVVM